VLTWLAADPPEDHLRISGRVHAGDDYDEIVLDAVEHLEWESLDETAPGVTVEDLTRLGKANQRLESGVDGEHKLPTEAEALGLIPIEGNGDVVVRILKEPDKAFGLSRQGAS